MNIIFKNTAYKILEIFMEYPNREFLKREIARELNMSHPSIMRYLDELLLLDLIRKREGSLYPTYYANTESSMLRDLKREDVVFRIKESGVIEYIRKEYLPSTIILFGSCAKGTYNRDSDIDLFVEAKKSKVDVTIFEKALKKKVNILFESDIKKLSPELRSNIVNGVVLYGYIRG